MLVVMMNSVTSDNGQKSQEFLFRNSCVVLPGDRDRNTLCLGNYTLFASSRVVYCEPTSA